MTNTPITDKAAFLVRWNERLAAYTTSKPNYDGGEVVEAERMRSLETAAQGLRDALVAFIKHVPNDHPDDLDRDRCPHCLAFKGAAEAITRFDALKEGK